MKNPLKLPSPHTKDPLTAADFLILKEILTDSGKKSSNLQASYKKIMLKHGLPATTDTKHYKLLKKVTKKKPWEQQLNAHYQNFLLTSTAANKYNSSLLARCLLAWLFLIFNKGKRPRSCSKNKENFGLKSNSVSVYGPVSYTHLTLPTICSV
eukprot:TRINITY_DN18757_c0_g1_i3.p1 TRINITY_DN18757_c0_g1~~TRINITY_DN18757_c0_g1_i3.p1  ORF type:complete len:153 (+),score=38.24 TRINITY_DN18757_c0_g1_i3:60-518(+)